VHLIFAVLDRFFVSSDLIFATLHRGRLFEQFPPHPLLLSSMLLYAPVDDSTLITMIAAEFPRREYDRLLFQRAKMELSACVQLMSTDAFSTKDAQMALVATLLPGVWAIVSGLTKLCKSLHDLTMMLARKGNWLSSPSNPAPTFRQLLAQQYGQQILTAPLPPREVSILRDQWIDYAQQHRVMHILGLTVQSRKDWTRVLDQPTGHDDFAIAYRPALRRVPRVNSKKVLFRRGIHGRRSRRRTSPTSSRGWTWIGRNRGGRMR
jgi:hypothetical protein